MLDISITVLNTVQKEIYIHYVAYFKTKDIRLNRLREKSPGHQLPTTCRDVNCDLKPPAEYTEIEEMKSS